MVSTELVEPAGHVVGPDIEPAQALNQALTPALVPAGAVDRTTVSGPGVRRGPLPQAGLVDPADTDPAFGEPLPDLVHPTPLPVPAEGS